MSSLGTAGAKPERLTLHNLLIVYPVIITIVKNLNFRQLIALAQTDKGCFTFLCGGNWDVDVQRWNNIRSKCLEICEFSDYHDYCDPIMEIKACKDCNYGVPMFVFSIEPVLSTYITNTSVATKYCIGPVKYLGERSRVLCTPCVEKHLVAHPRYQSKTELLDCQCTDGQDLWLCRPCWKVKYFACWHGPADICVDCGIKVGNVSTEVVICTWCQVKIL